MERTLSDKISTAVHDPVNIGKSPPGLFCNLRGDVSGAIAAVLVSLPLSMTVGVIAFAPLGSEYAIQGVMAGLFGAIILGAVSALFGSRSALISGPRAAPALILASLITNLLLSDDLYFPSGETTQHVIAISYFAILLAGAMQFICGAVRVGGIVKYIPYPVIAGFVNSSALLIIFSQSWVFLDVRKESTFMEEETFLDLLLRLNEAQPLTMLPGVVAIAVMVAASRMMKTFPSSLAGLAAGTATYYAMKAYMKGIDIGTTLGNIANKPSLDAPREALSFIPTFPITDMLQGLVAGDNLTAVLLLVIPAALSMAALASLDTAVSLSALDDMTEERSDFNKEVVGQGLGNVISAAVGGLIGAGGMVRTKPGYDAGGRTTLMSILTSVLMLLLVVLFARYIEFIPRAVIAGLIIVLGFQIFDRWSLSLASSLCNRHFYKRAASLFDLGVVLTVITTALIFDLIVAVGVGILLSIIIFVSRMSRSLVRNAFRGPAIRARNQWDMGTQMLLEEHGRKIGVLELEGSLFFGTAGSLETEIDKLMEDGAIYIVLDAKRLTDIDSTGCMALQRIQNRLKKHGGRLAISYVLKERRQRSQDFQGKDQRKRSSSRHIWSYLNTSEAVDFSDGNVFFSDTDTALTSFEETIINEATWRKEESRPSSAVPAIFHGLSIEEVKMIRRLATRQTVARGETIFSEGEEGNSIYYISKGRVAVIIKLPATGEQKRVQTLMEGTIFGEMAVLDTRPRAASVIAAEDSICYRLGIDAFESIKQKHQNTALRLFNNICLMFSDRIRSANTMISELEK